MAVTDAPFGFQKFITIRSQDLGPIKQPLTTSFSSNIDKVLKEGIKPKYGETPTSQSLRKLPKSGTHAKPSPRRAAFLLVSKTADGRIFHDSREKVVLLSLKTKQISYWIKFPFSSHFLSFVFKCRRQHCLLFCHLAHLKQIPK